MTSTDTHGQAPDTFIATHVKRGWSMAGVGTIEIIDRHDREIDFTGPEGSRTFGAFQLVEVTRPAPVMWAAEWPYPEFTAAEFAAHYLLAGEIIAARGYHAEEMQGYADVAGISIVSALKLAAVERAQAANPQDEAATVEIAAANVAEELETRLSAVIYTLGLLHSRTGIRDFSDQLAAWELGHYTTGPNPVLSDALGLLATAAGIFTHISDTQAPVTAPAVPAADAPILPF
jgi:signal transduction histidine kinase